MSDTLPVRNLFGLVVNILSIKAQQNLKKILLSNARVLSKWLTEAYLFAKIVAWHHLSLKHKVPVQNA